MMRSPIDTMEQSSKREFDNALLQKLSRLALLSEKDKAALVRVSSRPRVAPARSALIGQGKTPEGAFILLKGFACRYRYMADGQQQIISFLLPGDLYDLDCALLGQMDHAIVALTECDVAHVSSESLAALIEEHPRIAAALRLAKLAEEAMLRDWLVAIGRLRAPERLAHLFCELLDRLQAVGLADTNCCYLPLTQPNLADATGLSLVHVNRSLRELKSAGLITIDGKWLYVPDLPKLHASCEFSSRMRVMTPAAGELQPAASMTHSANQNSGL